MLNVNQGNVNKYQVSPIPKPISEFNQSNYDHFMESIITDVRFFPKNKQSTIELESNFIDIDNPLKLTLCLDLDPNEIVANQLHYFIGKTFKQARSELLELEHNYIKKYQKSVEYLSKTTTRFKNTHYTIDGSI